MKNKYGASDIKVLEGLEGIRKRPAMYIGSTGKEGLHHLVYEAVDNSVDEALAGYCTSIKVTINKDGSVTVDDNGRGIPVEMHPQFKIPAVQVALTKLHAGGKFDKKSYAISGGLHGVGISCVNALSKKLVVEVKRGGKIYQQEYSRGDAKTKLKIIGKCNNGETGTKIIFWPDEEIFSILDFDYKVLESRFREVSFLNAGLKINLHDKIKDKKEEFFSSGGLIEFVKWINKSKEVLHKPIYFKREVNGTILEIAIQYNTGYRENIFGFVNTINTVEGGTHIFGFKTGLTRVINDYAKKKGALKNGNLSGEDVREGITAIVSIKMGSPQFEGQTKTKLGNSEVKGFVDSVVTLALSEFFEENPSVVKNILSKALDSAKARLAAKKAKDLVRRKNVFSLGGLPGKLTDCSNKKSDNTELYLVEGESAGGCFSGDTKLALADGRNLSFKELVEEDNEGKINFCYTIAKNGSVSIGKIKNPRITKKNASVIKVTLDNNEKIICTEDHKFMLRDGSYKEAKKLVKTDSLMPFHKRISKMGRRITIEGYEMVWDQNKTWIFTHLLADKYNLEKGIYFNEQGDHKHHIDFNKRNNNPSNIIRMTKEDHLLLHTEHLDKTLHREDIKDKARKAHQTKEYREKMSQWAKQPEVNKRLSEKAKEQWKNNDYKEFMSKKFKEFCENNPEYVELNKMILQKSQKEYWSNLENRKKASEKIKKFFSENPEAKIYLSEKAKEQWKNKDLLVWRSEKTKEQWTPEFREKRKKAYNKIYYDRTIKLMKKVLEDNGTLESFEKTRRENKDNCVLMMKTFCSRFFNSDTEMMVEVVRNFNHKIKKIEILNERIHVYDIEVPKTHNFALSSGVFVHNSAKQARNKENQAILPLRGKILNVEKANPVKALSSEEITNMIVAIGTGVGEQFNLEKLRYKKIIIMSVDGKETTFVRNSSGEIQFVKIGEFIDKCKNHQINFNDYEVLCFGIKNNKTQFKKIKSVISHPIEENMFEIRTSYGRNVRVTSSHSVFVFEKNKIKLKKGNEIKKGNFIVAPKNLSLYKKGENESIDVLELFMKNAGEIKDKIYVRGKSVEELLKRRVIDKYGKNHKLTEKRVFISEEIRNVLIKRRKLKKFSQKYICNKLGIKQPCTYYDWEKGKKKPLLNNFRKYLALLDIREEEILPYVKIESSILENLWNNYYSNSGRNKVKNYIEFSELSFEDIRELGDVKICPRHYKSKGINRYVRVDNNLIKLIGFWLVEGSCSERNGIRLSIGNNNVNLVNELDRCFYNVFGVSPKLSKTAGRCHELKLVNRIASLIWKSFFGFMEFKSNNKKFPDIIFNVSKEMQLDFLRMYFLGDGTISKSNISFTTTSRDMASQLSYLLSSFGVVSSISEKEPRENEKIKSNHVAYVVSVNSREDLIGLKKVWRDHKNANHLEKKINSKSKSINKVYKNIANDLIALEVRSIKEIKSSSKLVYDFSVEGDENFIAGFGGLCCHNTDADVDGEHIKTLLLTFFFRFMSELIKNGNIFVAMPPLYRIRKKKDYYVYSDEELKEMTKKLGSTKAPTIKDSQSIKISEKNLNVTRFKGLGEMSSTQLWDTTMNPETRNIKKIFIEDAVEADHTFSMLMGDDVQARKQFIIENALNAELDV